jgi:hypothetical protein
MQTYGFRRPYWPLISHSDVVTSSCAMRPEDPLTNVTPVPQDHKFLFIIGAQKGGSTWLFNALATHPAFLGPSHAFGCVPADLV